MGVGIAIIELFDVLRSKQEEMTPEEGKLLSSCRRKAALSLFAGAFGGSAIVWAASCKLHQRFRIPNSIAAGAFFGVWGMNRSLDSSVDHFLSLDGSRMQKELANILVKRFPDDPQTMQLLPKHFSSEKVFDDSNDHPKLRWRYRNFYSDNVVHAQIIQGCDSHDDSSSDTNSYSQSKGTNLQTSRIVVNPGVASMAEADPLDHILGYSAPVEEIHDPNTPTKPRRAVHNHAHRRSHRRHRRIRHPEDLSNLDHATPA